MSTSMIATNNLTAIDLTDLAESDILTSLTVRTWVGQSNDELIRFALDSEYGPVVIDCPDARVSFSLDTVHYSDSLEYSAVYPVGPVVSVRSTAPLDQMDEQIETVITVGSETFPLTLIFAGTNDGEAAEPAFARYQDNKSRVIRDKFDSLSEVVTLIRYEPLIYDPCGSGSYGNDQARNRTVAQQNNPDNESFWSKEAFRARAFVGTRAINEAIYYDQSSPFPSQPFTDVARIAIDPEFEGFNPNIITARVPVENVNPGETGFRQTVWTLVRNDEEYHLPAISQQSYFRGSFLYYFSELVLVQYPEAGSRETYLPWSIIYSESSKPIGYLRSFAVGSVPLVDCSEYL